MTTEIAIQPPFHSGGSEDSSKVRSYDKAYKELKTQIISEDRDIFAKQVQQLKEFQRHTQELKNKTSTNIAECQANIGKLTAQSKKLDEQVKGYVSEFKSKNRQDQYKQQISKLQEKYVSACKKRIDLANSIDYKKLSKLDIDDRKSLAHQIFKWVIVAIYGEAENKYYWPNFQEQALEQDNAFDLKERLGKVNAMQSKEQQKVKTTSFISTYQTIRRSQQLKEVGAQCDKIRDIAIIFQECIEIGGKIKANGKLIEDSRKSTQQADEANLRSKARQDALNDRIGVIQVYLKQLHALRQSLQDKQIKYAEKIGQSQNFIKEMDSLASSFKPSVNTEENREQCQCAIY